MGAKVSSSPKSASDRPAAKFASASIGVGSTSEIDALVATHLERGPFIPGVRGDRPRVLGEGPLAAFASPDPMAIDDEVHPSILLADGLVRGSAPWETHEVLEALWLACGRVGPASDVLKAIIKLCAAEVKTRQGQLGGRASHTQGARSLLDELRRQHSRIAGIDVEQLYADAARMVADDAATLERIPFTS